MIAELKLTFENPPDNLLLMIQTIFPLNNVSLQNIINNTIYQNSTIVHSSFVHGYQAADSALLFQITGHELVIHIEMNPTNNLYISLKKKVNSYNSIMINYFKNNNIDTKKINKEVIISSEDSYILVGKIPDRNKEFRKELDNNKLRLIIIPVIVIFMNIAAKALGFVDKIESVVCGSVSMLLAILIWYLVEYVTFEGDDNEFKFKPIN